MVGRRTTLWGQLISFALIAVVLIWAVFPFYWALINSIKKPADTFVLSWIPWLQFQPTLEHWRLELGTREIRQAMFNSTVISVGAALLAMLLGTPAGYALARFHYQRVSNDSLLTWFLSQRVLPPVVVVVPLFLIMRSLNLIDTQLGLILLNATFTLPLAVIIMSQMFADLPQELEEAALVDGANRWQSFVRIALPLAAPGLVATWILCLAFSWNEFLLALALTTKDAIPMPVIIAGAEHTRGVQFWFVGVRVLLTMLPPTILALFAQRYLVRGLTLGAVKG
jgi:multiple sugar transport system permease protein